MSALIVHPSPQPGEFGPADTYPETMWLPVIGPTSYLTWRLFALELEHRDSWLTTDAEIAVRLGLGANSGPSPALRRSINRLERFGILTTDHHDSLHVRCRLPYLPDRYRQRLDAQLEAAHAASNLQPTHH